MSSTKSKKPKMTDKEKKQAQMAANRKAQLQWYALGGFLTVALIISIVLISVYTEGSVFSGHG